MISVIDFFQIITYSNNFDISLLCYLIHASLACYLMMWEELGSAAGITLYLLLGPSTTV